MGGEGILCVYGSTTWENEMDALRSSWPERVEQVGTGLEALAALEKSSFACIVVFPGLSDLTALECASRVQEAARGTPVITLVRVPEQTVDEVGGQKGNVWLYQRSCSQEFALPGLLAKIIRE